MTMQNKLRKSMSNSRGTLFNDFLEQIHNDISSLRSGEVAGYIPELLEVEQDGFGIAIATVDGYVYQVGDSQTPFSIQSVSKAFTYGIALQDEGEEKVRSKVDVEPSGEAFNSISLEPETGRPRNPMINAGAISITSMVNGRNSEEKVSRIMDEFARYTGHQVHYDEKIYLSEKRTGHRNRAISHMLRNYEILESDPEQSLDAYFRQCSIMVTCRDLAVMGACLANTGVNPITGIRALDARYVPKVLSVMASCGMYDYSGNWIYQVGMPAKSGVGGGIVAVLPGQFGLAVYSPRLDPRGNSVRGIAVCERLSSDLGLHMLHSSRVTSSTVIRSVYNAREVHSRRDRHPREMNFLTEHGGQVLAVELMAELTFVSSELIIREIETRNDEVRFLVLDFTRVTSIDQSACRIFSEVAQKYTAEGIHMLFVGIKDKYSFCDYLKRQFKTIDASCLMLFNDMSRALEWCEDQLAMEMEVDDAALDELPLEQQPLCAEMTEDELAFLESLLTEKRYTAGDIICREGEPAKLVYFIVAGNASAEISVDGKTRSWLNGLKQGGVFGESALLGNKVRSADVVADTDVLLKELVARELLSHEDPVAQKVLQKFFRNLSLMYDSRLRRANLQIRALSR